MNNQKTLTIVTISLPTALAFSMALLIILVKDARSLNNKISDLEDEISTISAEPEDDETQEETQPADLPECKLEYFKEHFDEAEAQSWFFKDDTCEFDYQAKIEETIKKPIMYLKQIVYWEFDFVAVTSDNSIYKYSFDDQSATLLLAIDPSAHIGTQSIIHSTESALFIYTLDIPFDCPIEDPCVAQYEQKVEEAKDEGIYGTWYLDLTTGENEMFYE